MTADANTTSGHSGTALVLGATGGIGGEMAATLVRRGWQVRALHRDPARAGKRDGIAWQTGDAMRRADVLAAAEGAQLIVHAVNPPGYRRWSELVLPMLDNSLAAARATGARLLLPGTVYNYGPDAFPLLTPDAPQNALTRKGRIRVEMERRMAAAAETGVRALVVRAGDYFGPRARNNWFGQMVKPGRPVTAIAYPGHPGVGHAWAYLPDLAETMMRIVEREAKLAPFDVFHFGGHWDEDGQHMTNAIRRAVGRLDLPARGFPWPIVRLAAPFVTTFREVLEVRYLWRERVQLDNRKLLALLGTEPHTPIEDAVRTTLIGLGCLAPAA